LEFEQEVAELGEAFRAELLRPSGFHLGDRVADHADRGDAPLSEDDAFGTEVVRVWFALEVTEVLEFAEEVVERLSADPQVRRDVGWPCTLRSWVSEYCEVGAIEVVEAAFEQALKHVLLDRLPRDSQEGADQGRPEGFFVGRRRVCKTT
jgi:hypothetical protein